MQNDVLATGIMSFLMHEIVYFGRSLPWIFIDSLGLLKNYKIQNVSEGRVQALIMGTFLTHPQNKIPSLQEQWNCAKFVLLSHFTVELPQIWWVQSSVPRERATNVAQVVPPNGSILWAFHLSSFSFCVDHGLSNCDFLCFRGHVALFLSPRSPLGPLIQGHSQNSSSVLRTFRHGSRVCVPDWGYDSWVRHCRLSNSLVCSDRRSAHLHYVRLDRVAPVSGHRCTQWLRIPLESSPFPSILGWRWPPRPPPREIYWQLFQQLPVVGLFAWHWIFPRGSQAAKGK